MSRLVALSIIKGIAALGAILGIYFAALSLVSGWSFAVSQFGEFWFFIVTLAIGFGIQIGLYVYLKGLLHHSDTSGKLVAATGTTSTIAMVSCCAHYLVNILPILGATSIATIAAQYQVKFFWVGIVFNILGIAFIARRVVKAKTMVS